MNNQYDRALMITSATRVLDAEMKTLLASLPADLGATFALVVAHDRTGDSVGQLGHTLELLRGGSARLTLTEVSRAERLAVLLALVGYLTRRPEGWQREALTGLVAAAAARTSIEARARLGFVEQAIAARIDALTADARRSVAA